MSESPFSEPVNPYSSPSSEAYPGAAPLATPQTIQALSQTRPWVMFLSILGFLGSALMIFGGLVGAVAGFAGGMSGMGGWEAAFIFGIYFFFGLLYIIPSFFLFRYAQLIGEFVRDASGERLAAALQAQKSFWKFVGILMALVLCLYCVAIPVMMFAGLAAR